MDLLTKSSRNKCERSEKDRHIQQKIVSALGHAGLFAVFVPWTFYKKGINEALGVARALWRDYRLTDDKRRAARKKPAPKDATI